MKSRRLPLVSETSGADVPRPRAARLSLTDRCDLACVYCRPHKHDGYRTDPPLDLEAWRRLALGLKASGIQRVRITGGEPLLSPKVVPAVQILSELGFTDVALTTNATRLRKLAAPLKRAGLHRLNVSLDSLDPARFARLTRGGVLGRILEGLAAAEEAGFSRTKLNTVVLRGENDAELVKITEFAWGRRMIPRFLEVMAIGEGARLGDQLVSSSEVQERLAPLLDSEEAQRETDRGPARYRRARHDATLLVGFISGATQTYCEGCDRIRVASNGELRPCLATSDAVPLANGGEPEEITRAIDQAWSMKPDGHTFRGCTERSARDVSIRAIGG